MAFLGDLGALVFKKLSVLPAARGVFRRFRRKGIDLGPGM